MVLPELAPASVAWARIGGRLRSGCLQQAHYGRSATEKVEPAVVGGNMFYWLRVFRPRAFACNSLKSWHFAPAACAGLPSHFPRGRKWRNVSTGKRFRPN